MFVNRTVPYLIIDLISNMPIIVLKEVGGQRYLITSNSEAKYKVYGWFMPGWRNW